jgi:hypothetical protein
MCFQCNVEYCSSETDIDLEFRNFVFKVADGTVLWQFIVIFESRNVVICLFDVLKGFFPAVFLQSVRFHFY